MEQPDIALRFAPVTVAMFLRNTIDNFAEIARAKGVELKANSLTDTKILADEEALVKVFNNLIENALRYTPSGGSITVHEYKQDHFICIAVRDTGCGIPQKCLPFVFD